MNDEFQNAVIKTGKNIPELVKFFQEGVKKSNNNKREQQDVKKLEKNMVIVLK